jgi:hypothetical protein
VPTSSEGGYPQVFWMRLAARTFQQTGAQSHSGSVGASDPAAEEEGEDAAARAAADMNAAAAPAVAPVADTSDSVLVRKQLRGFCQRWSQSLPAFGDLLNLVGEDPNPAVKRLAAGIFGATALLCMAQFRALAAQPPADEESPPLPPHQHMCPTQAGFWAAFLIPGPGADMNISGGATLGTPVELIAAQVEYCNGPSESIRRCSCTVCCGDEKAHEYVSRRDTDWFFLATVPAGPSSAAPTEERACGQPEVNLNGEGQCGVPSAAEAGSRTLAFSPLHFVCLLDGDPCASPSAAGALQQLHSLLAERQVAASLPPAYPLHRYTRRTLLLSSPLGGRASAPTAKFATSDGAGATGSGGSTVSDGTDTLETASDSTAGTPMAETVPAQLTA